MNIATFTGHLGRDAEQRSIQSGDKITSFPLAVSVGTRANEQTMWVDCSIWGERGAKIAAYLRKGGKVTVHGRITLDQFQKKDGTMDKALRLNVQEIDLPPRSEGQAAAPAAKPAGNPGSGFEDMNDDIPF